MNQFGNGTIEKIQAEFESFEDQVSGNLDKHSSTMNNLIARITKLEAKKKFFFWSIFNAFSIVFFIIFLALIINNFFEGTNLDKPFLGWFIVSATLLAMGLITFISLASNTNKLHEKIAQENKLGLKSILQSISDNLTPTVYAHSTLSDVALTATQILEKAINEEKINNRYVYYFGALNLSVSEYDESHEEAIESNQFLANYIKVQKKLNTAGIEVSRFINLIKTNEFSDRSDDIKKKYKNWLSNQVSTYTTQNYNIFKARRAPSWMDTNSYIITHRSYLHVSGFGNAAIHVSSPQLVKKIRETTLSVIKEAQKEENQPKLISPSELKTYYKEILVSDKG